MTRDIENNYSSPFALGGYLSIGIHFRVRILSTLAALFSISPRSNNKKMVADGRVMVKQQSRLTTTRFPLVHWTDYSFDAQDAQNEEDPSVSARLVRLYVTPFTLVPACSLLVSWHSS